MTGAEFGRKNGDIGLPCWVRWDCLHPLFHDFVSAIKSARLVAVRIRSLKVSSEYLALIERGITIPVRDTLFSTITACIKERIDVAGF